MYYEFVGLILNVIYMTGKQMKLKSRKILLISNILCVPDLNVILEQKEISEKFYYEYVRYEEYYEKNVDFSDIDIIVIWINFECMFPDALVNCKIEKNNISEIYSKMTQEIMKLYSSVKKESRGLVFLMGVEDYCYEITRIIGTISLMSALVDRINITLMESIDKGDRFIDLKRLIAEVGRNNSYNSTWKYRWNAPYSQMLIEHIANEIYNHYSSLYHVHKKCIILDCDNVLWGGTLVEDGIENIHLGADLGREYQDFQRYILYLYNLGICVCICSKNSEVEVRKMFQEHSGMILKEKHIASFQVSWDSKVKGIRNIQQQLNIGLESMIFIDDSQNEIDEVQKVLPDVRCILFEKKDIYSNIVLFIDDSISTYDVQLRHDTYKKNAFRNAILKKSVSEKEYFNSLETQVVFSKSKQVELGRISELLFRANRRTIGIRLTKSEIHNTLEDSKFTHLSVNVKDKFSDLGLVGYICIYKTMIVAFVLSCRAMGRDIEEKMINYAIKKGASSFVFVETGKNEDLYNLFMKKKFTLVGTDIMRRKK